MIKAIIVDMGGVYFSNGTELVIDKMSKITKKPKTEIYHMLRGQKSRLFHMGRITPRAFWSWFAKSLGLNKDETARMRNLWYSSYRPMPGMKPLVARLRKKYKTIVFSGNIEERVKFLDRKYGICKDFDYFVWSYDAGSNKDSIAFYEYLAKKLKKLGLAPNECIMIDDQDVFLNLLRPFGFKFVLFKTAKQADSDIKKILANSEN